MASARLSEREVPGSILGDFTVCFHFPLIRVAIALNIPKTEHSQREGGGGGGGGGVKGVPWASIDTSFVTVVTTDVK